MPPTNRDTLAIRGRHRLLRSDVIFESFCEKVTRPTEACHEMSRRFLNGGAATGFWEWSRRH